VVNGLPVPGVKPKIINNPFSKGVGAF